MARVHRVQKSAKEHTCGKGHVIPKGDPYLWAKPGFRRRTPLIRCVDHPFRQSELATGQNQEVLAAREDFVDTVNGLEQFDYDGLQSAVDDFQSALDDYVALREEALEAWPNGNATLEELRDNAQNVRDEFEPDVEEFPDEEPEQDDEESDEDFETRRDDWESDRDEHWETAINDAVDAAEGLDL